MNTANTVIGRLLGALFALGLAFSAGQAASEEPAGFSQPELDQMLAPIALYPDTVLSHVLIAATYPLEVVQAARWSRANPGLAGEYAVEAVEHMPWDPSVMALVAFPELLARMDADLVWTQRLGDAFLVQEYQVLDTIQYLRDEAYAAGHLRSNEYVRVVREPTYIYIEPAVTRVVYVPYYDPRVVYGSWRYSSYPPVFWDRPHGYRSGFSFYWSSGYHVQPAFFFSSFHWSSRRVVVHDHYRYGHRDRGKYAYAGHKFSSGRDVAHYKNSRPWKHNPEHRRGVAYRRGIDERHAIKASNRSDHYRDERRDLLRQRSRAGDFTTRRPAARTTASDPRSRQVPDSAARSRNAIRRDGSIGRTANRRETAATGRRSAIASTPRSSSQRSSRTDTRRAAPDRTSIRRELAQGRTSPDRQATRAGSRERSSDRARATAPDRDSSRRALAQGRTSPDRQATRASSRERSPNRARGAQLRSSNRQTSSAPKPRSASRISPRSSSRSRAPAADRAAVARSRPSTGSRNLDARSSRQAISRESSRAAPNRARKASAPSSRKVRTEAPTRARSRGSSSRAETLRSRGRERRQ